MEKISVCMASYNGEKYIKSQILSILSQLEKDDELIISDDQSTDKTVDIIKSLNDIRIKLLMNTGRKGPVGNFENALVRATGEFIFLTDQDDIWETGKVKIVRVLLTSNDLVLSDCQVVNQDGAIIYKSFFQYRGSRKGFLPNLFKNSYMGCCMSFRREILSYALPFPPAIHMHDWWIGLLVELRGKVIFHPVPLIKYVRHGSNASPTGEKSYSKIIQFKNRLILVSNIIRRIVK